MDKIVLFTPTAFINSYSIILGDIAWDGSIDINRKNDRNNAEFVLSTVAKTIAFFLSDFPEAEIIIEGSTLSRTRLYQLAIRRGMDDLGRYFDIYGMDGDNLEIFQKGKMYRSFVVTVKSERSNDNL